MTKKKTKNPGKSGVETTTSTTMGKPPPPSPLSPHSDPWMGLADDHRDTLFDLPEDDPADWTPRPGIIHPTGTGFLPRWIQDQIETNKFRAPTPKREAAEHHICRDCAAIIISGVIDEHTTPGRIISSFTADPTPLSEPQETACSIVGRTTYRAELNPFGGGIRILRSRIMAYERTHPPPRGGIVLPAHQCGARFDGFHTPPVTSFENERPSNDDAIPF